MSLSIRPLASTTLLLALLHGACTVPGTPGPSPETRSASAVLDWNETARGLAASDSLDPPLASHLYALLSIAQYRALREGSAYDGDAAVTAASTTVLARFFPRRAAELEERAASRLAPARAGGAPSMVAAGERAGRETALHLLERVAEAEKAAAAADPVPTGPGRWFSARGGAPLRPGWGRVRPWFLRVDDELRPPPPPTYGSKDFTTALAEVRRAVHRASPRERERVHYWADGRGTPTPPGHWNEIAVDLIRKHGVARERAAYILAVLNAGLMDAGIACWDAKYAYWLIRPSQADSAITPLVRLPNFPSYPSGHSYFSGTAGEILTHFFPAERRLLLDMAEEAAESRVVGGLHYRFDSTVGLRYGRAIGRLVLERARRTPELLLGQPPAAH